MIIKLLIIDLDIEQLSTENTCCYNFFDIDWFKNNSLNYSKIYFLCLLISRFMQFKPLFIDAFFHSEEVDFMNEFLST